MVAKIDLKIEVKRGSQQTIEESVSLYKNL